MKLNKHCTMVTNIGFHNYTNCSFSSVEQQVLGYGSKFRPTTSLPSINTLTSDLGDFERRIRWHEVFHYRPDPILQSRADHYIPGFHLNSSKEPPKASASVETSILAFKTELFENVAASRFYKRSPNLSKSERRAIEALNARTDIVICNADKNLGTAVLNKADYIAEGLRQLDDRKFYRKVASQPVNCNKHVPFSSFVPEVCLIEDELKDICNEHSDVLSQKDILAMFSCFPFKPAKLYLLPKLHKPLGPHGPKGRPIVSCIGYCTSPASKFIDHHLRAVLSSLEDSTILKDTAMLTSVLSKSDFRNDAMLATADVESLYTNMNWEDTVSAINTLLLEAKHKLHYLLIDLLKFVLENNYFTFNDNLYLQEYGMAMGTPMAVNVANAFLYVHERNSIAMFRRSIYHFSRFVDDLFLIVSASSDLDALKNSFYNKLSTIRLTWSTAAVSCIFLDLEIFKEFTDNNLCTFEFKTFQKPLNAYLYIPFKSDHPRSNLRAFIKGELIRYNRTNTRLKFILDIRRNFWLRLRRRGYPPPFLAEVFLDVLPAVNKHAVSRSKVSKKSDDPVVFCTSFHPHFTKTNYKKLLKQCFFRNGKIYFRKTNQLFS